MNKHVVIKGYWNMLKEEKWLNKMASMGYSLIDYTWMRYVFEESEKDEYAYAIELLSSRPHSLEGKAYISFLEESGIDCVATYMNWAYFRKKKSELKETDGKLVIYSDYESQKAHIKRLIFFFLPIIIMNIGVGFSNIGIGLSVDHMGRSPINIFLGLTNILLGVILLLTAIPYIKYFHSVKKAHKLSE